MYGSMKTIHLIIPCYRDREALARLLPDLLSKGWPPDHITVVDADPEPPFPFAVNWIPAPPDQPGRAKQMNLGAANSQADILLFLHADTTLPATAASQIRDALASGYIGGGFSRRFDSPSRFLRITCRLADLRGQHLGWFFGDQAQFVTRQAFEMIGGFPEIHPFEDLELSRRLKQLGPLCLLKPGILSSARRFEKDGPFLRTAKDLLLTLSHFLIPNS
jgi:GT2 family glycosyltransferase